MTEPTYEVNFEKLSSLSIADLTGLINFLILNPTTKENRIQGQIFVDELSKRINDIIIF